MLEILFLFKDEKVSVASAVIICLIFKSYFLESNLDNLLLVFLSTVLFEYEKDV